MLLLVNPVANSVALCSGLNSDIICCNFVIALIAMVRYVEDVIWFLIVRKRCQAAPKRSSGFSF